MNRQQQEKMLEIAHQVRAATITMAEGTRLLNESVDLNVRSARIILSVYLRLCKGTRYTLRPSEADLNFLMSSFGDSANIDDLVSALDSLRRHIAWREDRGDGQGANRAILAKYEARLAALRAGAGSAGSGILRSIAMELNARAREYAIGSLQARRKRIKGHKRLALGSGAIFHDSTIDSEGHWAFHFGGRSELQFNIGLLEIAGVPCFRFGVAFSLEPSQTLPDVTILYENIKRFNDYMRLYPDVFPDFQMGYWEDEFTGFFDEKLVRLEKVKRGTFIFFGKHLPISDYSPDIVLRTFDELLPLYEYVEGPPGTEPLRTLDGRPFEFTPGGIGLKTSTQYTQQQRVIDVSLRHIEIQSALFARLKGEHGSDNVACEQFNGAGMKIDVVVRRPNEYWYYEIKTGDTARACIREALGQLLEYSYWPEAQAASKLIVVGEPPLDSRARTYIADLRERFSLPIEYQQQLV